MCNVYNIYTIYINVHTYVYELVAQTQTCGTFTREGSEKSISFSGL